jgi:GlpG protein
MIEEPEVDRAAGDSEVLPRDESPAAHESDDPAADRIPDCTTQPWVTRLGIIACIGIHLGLAVENDHSPGTLAKFGYLPADAIWRGGYWALVTSAFVHIELWHLAANVSLLWVLGSRLERAIGSLRYLAFVVLSAFVSSSIQLATSGTTGIGASGVGYAIFGFMWSTRWQYARFPEVINSRTIQSLNLWLVGCIVATWLGVWNVGNAAHVSGMLFGAIAARAFVLRFQPRLMFACLGALLVFSIVPLFWCPWSITWLSIQAYNAHTAQRYDAALDGYTQIIRRDPRNAWAYHNRSAVYEALGEPEMAEADLERAREIDPTMGVQ